MSTRRVALHVLDDIALFIDEHPVALSEQDELLLALLTASGYDGCDLDQAAAELWDQEPTPIIRQRVEQDLDRLRMAHPGVVLRATDRWRLTLRSEDVDLWSFHQKAGNDRTDWSAAENVRLLHATVIFPDIRITDVMRSEVDRFNTVRQQIVATRRLSAPTSALRWRPFPPALARSNRSFLAAESRRTVQASTGALLESGGRVPTMVVSGEPGSGKTRTLALVAEDLHILGMEVIYLTGRDLDGMPLGELAVPISLQALDTPLPDEPYAVVVDDLDGLGRPIVDALLTLRSRTGVGGLFLVVAGADDAERLMSLRREVLHGRHVTLLTLAPLELAEIIEIVAHRFPEASATARTALAQDLRRRSAGVPGEIVRLLTSVNGATYTVDRAAGAPAGDTEERYQAARWAADGGRYRTVVELLTAGPGSTDEAGSELRALLTLALHRSGADAEARRVRAELVERALVERDHEAALVACLIGLPEAEGIDGDETRLRQLLSVDPDGLNRDSRFRHAGAITRQATLLGRVALAVAWQHRAAIQGRGPDDRAALAVAHWYSSSLDTRPATRIRRVQEVLALDALSVQWRARLHQIRSIDRYEDGRLPDAILDNRLLGSYADGAGDRLRQWHHLAFAAMVAFDAGRWDRADELRVQALVHANRHAIVNGEALFLAQAFHEGWIKDGHGEFTQIFGHLSPEIAASRFGRAAMVSCCHAAGQTAQAGAVAEPLIDEILGGPPYDAMALCALLSSFIAARSDPATTRAVVKLMSAQSGSSIVVGAGIACLGPVDRYLFHLTGDRSHLDQAITQADEADLRVWRVVLRMERQSTGGDRSGFMRRQAQAIAAGTDLSALIES